jgi:hypothetical protein
LNSYVPESSESGAIDPGGLTRPYDTFFLERANSSTRTVTLLSSLPMFAFPAY